MNANLKREKSAQSDVDRLASKILQVFPELEKDSRRMAVNLYRLLSKGKPVTRAELAEATGITAERVNEVLDGWEGGVYYEDEKIVGFWGLTIKPVSKHLLKFDGHTEYAWCAWDTLFLPELVGKTMEIESVDPEAGESIRLTVSPDGVEQISPAGAVLSILEPTEEMTEDIVATFCHFVHFFPSREVGEAWTAKNPGTSLLTVEEGFELGKRRNRGQFKEALEPAGP